MAPVMAADACGQHWVLLDDKFNTDLSFLSYMAGLDSLSSYTVSIQQLGSKSTHHQKWAPGVCVRHSDSHASVTRCVAVKLESGLRLMCYWAMHTLCRAKRTSGSRDMQLKG